MRLRTLARIAMLISIVVATWAPSRALAANPGPAPSAMPTTPTPTPATTPGAPAALPALDEARRRYDRALELSDEGNYDEALVELQRAYALAPTYRLLYNLGVVSVAVHDYVKAIDYFTRYLQEGGTEIDPARVSEVQTQVQRLRTRIARVIIDVSLPNADVAVDDVTIGKAPIAKPVVLNSGRHRISASLPGYFTATQVIELAGNDSKVVTLNLQRATTAEKPSRPIPWLAWGVTGVLAAGTAVTGVLALSAANNYDSTVGTLGTNGSDVSSAYKKMRVLSVTSDVLLGATIIAGGVSLYLTIKPVKATGKEKAALMRHVTASGFAF